jgi:hypothetical protein
MLIGGLSVAVAACGAPTPAPAPPAGGEGRFPVTLPYAIDAVTPQLAAALAGNGNG